MKKKIIAGFIAIVVVAIACIVFLVGYEGKEKIDLARIC